MTKATKQTSGNFKSLALTEGGQPASFVFKTMKHVAASSKQTDHTPHRHQFYSIIWITQGSGTHLVDFKSYPANPNTLFFISPEQVHDLRMDGPHEGYVILFNLDFAEQSGPGKHLVQQSGFFFRCDDVAPLTLQGEAKTNALLEIIRMIDVEYREKSMGFEQAIGALLQLFLLRCQRISTRQAPPRVSRKRSGAQIVRQFKDLLDTQFATWHKVADYAQALHLTANYLNEVLSQETGMSAKDFILSRIMLEAKRYATQSDISAKEVAYLLGFQDPAHFSKLFKQIENQVFTDFRQEFRKKYN